MGKSTISMAIFQFAMLVITRGLQLTCNVKPEPCALNRHGPPLGGAQGKAPGSAEFNG